MSNLLSHDRSQTYTTIQSYIVIDANSLNRNFSFWFSAWPYHQYDKNNWTLTFPKPNKNHHYHYYYYIQHRLGKHSKTILGYPFYIELSTKTRQITTINFLWQKCTKVYRDYKLNIRVSTILFICELLNVKYMWHWVGLHLFSFLKWYCFVHTPWVIKQFAYRSLE